MSRTIKAFNGKSDFFFCITRIHVKADQRLLVEIVYMVYEMSSVSLCVCTASCPSIGRTPDDMFSPDGASTLLTKNHETHKIIMTQKALLDFRVYLTLFSRSLH